MSNLSGHHYRTSGHYKVQGTGAQQKILFDSDPHALRIAVDGSLEIMFIGRGWPMQPWFTMKKQPPPITFELAADGSDPAPRSFPLGATLLVRYPASRKPCHSANGANGGFVGAYEIDHSEWNMGEIDFGLAGAVDGTYSALVDLPAAGHDLAIWFQDQEGACSKYDWANGQNFHFVLQP